MIDKEKLDALNQIIDEGNHLKALLDSPAWVILKRTILAKGAQYKAECYEAAKKAPDAVGNFLGRMEALDDLVKIIEEDFADAAKRAILEKEALLRAEEEMQDIDNSITASLSRPMHQVPGLI